jgi:hypothetical protein
VQTITRARSEYESRSARRRPEEGTAEAATPAVEPTDSAAPAPAPAPAPTPTPVAEVGAPV